jgi:hypothetical protein
MLYGDPELLFALRFTFRPVMGVRFTDALAE